MAVKTDTVLLQKLKKKVRILQRKETQGRNKLRAALKKMHKLGRGYKNKLASKARMMKSKIEDTEASTYVKAAEDVERQLLKSIEVKAKALHAAVTRLEKKSISKLRKSIAKKAKKSGGAKPTRKSADSLQVKSVKRKKRQSRAK